MRPKYLFHLAILVVSLLFLWGCMERPLTLQVRFSDVSGLKQGNTVFFERNEIGSVKNITYTQQGDYLVKIEIIPGFKNAATEDSKFYIGDDALERPNKAVIVEQERPGGMVLKNGSIVQGTVRGGYLDEIIHGLKEQAAVAESELRKSLEELKKSLNKETQNFNAEMEATLDDLSRQFQNFSNEISKIPDSEEVKQLEESFKQFAEEFKRLPEDVRNYLKNEIIPQLQLELDKLRKQLEKQGRGAELEKIEKQMNEISVV